MRSRALLYQAITEDDESCSKILAWQEHKKGMQKLKLEKKQVRRTCGELWCDGFLLGAQKLNKSFKYFCCLYHKSEKSIWF